MSEKLLKTEEINKMFEIENLCNLVISMLTEESDFLGIMKGYTLNKINF